MPAKKLDETYLNRIHEDAVDLQLFEESLGRTPTPMQRVVIALCDHIKYQDEEILRLQNSGTLNLKENKTP